MVISCSNRKRGYRTQIRNLFTGGKIDPYIAAQQPSELHVGVLDTKQGNGSTVEQRLAPPLKG